jgi:hypothetical protein
MEQRPLRLGDTLDDYCPRERRVTNHAVVAMIEDAIKQTRCTTCDTEHAYKGARVPRKRKKETPSALYKEVLAGMPETEAAPVLTGGNGGNPATEPPIVELSVESAALEAANTPVVELDEPIRTDVDTHEAATPTPEPAEEGPVHRPLIRATLPRPEGQKDERRLPEFTIRQPGGRGNGHFRGGDNRPKTRGPAGPGGPGNRPHGGQRFAGSRPAQPSRGQSGRGPSAGFRGGQPRPGGGRKRSR